MAGAREAPAKQLTGYLLGVGASLAMSERSDDVGFVARIFCELVPAEKADPVAYHWQLRDVCTWAEKHKQKLLTYPLSLISWLCIFAKMFR